MSLLPKASLRSILVGLLLVGSLTACLGFGGLKSQMLGVWTDGQSTMEFKDNGTVLIKLAFNEVNGYWKVTDNSHVEMQFTGVFSGFASGIYEVHIDNDTMTVAPPQGGGTFSLRKFNN